MSELEERLKAFNAEASQRIEALRKREAARELTRRFLDDLGELAEELWDTVGKEALGVAARALLADALEQIER